MKNFELNLSWELQSNGMEEWEYEDEDDNGLPKDAVEIQGSNFGDDDDNGVKVRTDLVDKRGELSTELTYFERNEAEIKVVEVNLGRKTEDVDNVNDNGQTTKSASYEFSFETANDVSHFKPKDFCGVKVRCKDLNEHECMKEDDAKDVKKKVENEQNTVTDSDGNRLISAGIEINGKADEHKAITLGDISEKKPDIPKDDRENSESAEDENGRTTEDETAKSNSEDGPNDEAPTDEKTDNTNNTYDGLESCRGRPSLTKDTGQVIAEKEETETISEATDLDERGSEESLNLAKTTQHGNTAAIKPRLFSNFNCILTVVVLAVIGQFQGVGGTLKVFPKDVLVLSGDIGLVRLPCSTDLTEAVYWERIPFGSSHQQTVYAGTNGGLNYVDNTRFNIDKSEQDGRYDIVIKNVQMDDAGTYICIDQAGFGEKKFANLVLIENFDCKIPTPPDGFVAENVFGLEENNIYASCVLEFKGNLNPLFVWKWNNTGNALPSSQSKEGSLMKSEVTIRPKKQLNGVQLSCTLSLNSVESEPQWKAITWTSDPLKVNYATLETADVEVCGGSGVIPLCNPECKYHEDQVEDGQCHCIATYEVKGERKSVTFNKYVCDSKDAVLTVVLPVLIIVFVAALTAVIITVICVVVVRRRSKHRKSKTVAKDAKSCISTDTEQSESDVI